MNGRVHRLDAPVVLKDRQDALCVHTATFDARFSSAKDVFTVGDSLPLRLAITWLLVEPVHLSRIEVNFQDDRYCLVLHASSAGELEAGAVRADAHVVVYENLEVLPNKASVFHVEVRCFSMVAGGAERPDRWNGEPGPGRAGVVAWQCLIGARLPSLPVATVSRGRATA